MGRVKPFLWLISGAILAFFSLGDAPLPFCVWVAPPLLLHFARIRSPLKGLPAIMIAFAIATGIADIGVLPFRGTAYAAIVAGIALSASLPYLVDRLIAPRLPGIPSTLVFPLAWVSVEFVGSRLSPSATWGLSGYTQFANLPLVQLAATTGTFGITFLVGWFASVVNWSWDLDFTWNKIRPGVLLYAGIFSLVMLAGSVRLAIQESPVRVVRAAVVSYPRDMFNPGEATRIRFGRVSSEEREPLREKMMMLQDWFLEATHREALAGAKIIIWPELNFLVFKEDEPAFMERAQRLARENSAYLLMGMASVTLGADRPLENKAVLVDDSGRVVCSYLKGHRVTGPEETLGKPGNDRPFVGSTSYGRAAVAICFDMDFPEFIREAGEQRADLLLVPANDWQEIKHIHSWMAAFRAVENGATMIRATSTGFSTVVDPYGRTLAVTDHFSPGARIMVAQVPLARTGTVYAQVGDLFSWLCLVGLALLICLGVIRRRSS